MNPEDVLLLGTGALIVANRVFTSTALKEQRAAYVAIQLVDIAGLVALMLFFRLEGFPPKLDLSVRVFLMLVLVWHMVLNNQARAGALRRSIEERKELLAKAERRARALAAIHAENDEAAASEEPAASTD